MGGIQRIPGVVIVAPFCDLVQLVLCGGVIIVAHRDDPGLRVCGAAQKPGVIADHLFAGGRIRHTAFGIGDDPVVLRDKFDGMRTAPAVGDQLEGDGASLDLIIVHRVPA